MRSIREWIDQVAQRFEESGLYYGHGTGNSRDEAVWLVLHVMGVPVQTAFNGWDDVPSECIAREIEDLAERRIRERCPLAYLTGTAWFAGLEFEVNTDVLVPRSPLAELITGKFAPWLNSLTPEAILDLGTGSACIAIACAVQFPESSVDAVDISQAALEVARRNVNRHGLDGRVELHQSDLFNSLEPRKYDLIVSNPPYVPERALAALPREYRAEPVLGLISALDGLEIPLRILRDALKFLASDGILVCEVGESQNRLQAALPGVPFLWLEFEAGGSGVFLLERHQLEAAAEAADEILKER